MVIKVKLYETIIQTANFDLCAKSNHRKTDAFFYGRNFAKSKLHSTMQCKSESIRVESYQYSNKKVFNNSCINFIVAIADYMYMQSRVY